MVTVVVAVGLGVGELLTEGATDGAVAVGLALGEALGAHGAGAPNWAKVTAAFEPVAVTAVPQIPTSSDRAIRITVDLRILTLVPDMFEQ